jgi:hypothetical protein
LRRANRQCDAALRCGAHYGGANWMAKRCWSSIGKERLQCAPLLAVQNGLK